MFFRPEEEISNLFFVTNRNPSMAAYATDKSWYLKIMHWKHMEIPFIVIAQKLGWS